MNVAARKGGFTGMQSMKDLTLRAGSSSAARARSRLLSSLSGPGEAASLSKTWVKNNGKITLGRLFQINAGARLSLALINGSLILPSIIKKRAPASSSDLIVEGEGIEMRSLLVPPPKDHVGWMMEDGMVRGGAPGVLGQCYCLSLLSPSPVGLCPCKRQGCFGNPTKRVRPGTAQHPWIPRPCDVGQCCFLEMKDLQEAPFPTWASLCGVMCCSSG